MVYAHYPNRRGLIDQFEPPLKTQHFFPKRSDQQVSFLTYREQSRLQITQNTPIASIGSCFAREIRQWLIDHDYDFLQTATGPGTGAGSARYDRVYSTFGIRQEFERAFDSFHPITSYWEFEEDGKKHILDPYRYTVAWENHAERIQECEEHRLAVYQAFTQAKVLIITVGQGEIWYDARDGSVFPVLPPIEVYQPEIHKFRCSTYLENLNNLRRCRDLIHAHNPDVHLIVTTSPVPLKLTFSGENSIIANCAMKSMLRAVVDEFVNESDERVSYFPAYEVVTQLAEHAFTEDGRHVTRETVAMIMELFESLYLKNTDVGILEEDSQSDSDLQWISTALSLKRDKEWSKLAVYLEGISPSKLTSKKDELYLADFYGEACLRLGREEDARGQLLKARQLASEFPQLKMIQSESQVHMRLNYLIALSYLEDDELTYQLSLELMTLPQTYPQITNQILCDMVLLWLNHLQNHQPLHAMEMSTRLLENAPILQANHEFMDWFEKFINEFRAY